MQNDPELNAMAEVAKVLQPLNDEQRGRIVQWTISRFGIVGSRLEGDLKEDIISEGNDSGDSNQDNERKFETFAELYNEANPSSNPEKALVGGYWCQVVLGKDTFGGQQINSELKHLGHGLHKINDAFTSLISMKPSLALQVRKKGTTKQARKKYKLTVEGISRVKQMLDLVK